MKLPRRRISASGRGRCRAAGRVARRMGANLSDRGRCALIVGFPAGGATTSSRAWWGNGCRNGLASRSSSRTGRAPAAISPPKRS